MPAQPSKYAANETELVVRLPVSLTPALPRMVRVGDVFESGVVVSAPDAGAEPLAVTVTATVTGPSSGNVTGDAGRKLLADDAPSDPQQASIVLVPQDPYARETTLTAAKQQREVRFRFTAVRVGESGLRFDVYLGTRASQAPRASDSASFDVPVLGRQSEVFLATSFSLRPNGSEAAGQVEGLALPAADPGSGSVDLVAGVGNLPFLQVGGLRLLAACLRVRVRGRRPSVLLITSTNLHQPQKKTPHDRPRMRALSPSRQATRPPPHTHPTWSPWPSSRHSSPSITRVTPPRVTRVTRAAPRGPRPRRGSLRRS